MAIPIPNWITKPLEIPFKLLMVPGPSNVPPRVLHAMSRPILGPMYPELFEIMDEVKDGIRYLFQTRNELTLALSSSGHGGMEAIFCNLIEPGDKVLIGVSGFWAERAADISTRYGAVTTKIFSKPGTNFSLQDLEGHIQRIKPKLLFLVQGESSSGVFQPIEGVGEICEKYGCLLAVDVVASLSCVPFLMDKWEVDAAYTGSQKILSAPAGITPISFSEKAQKIMFDRRSPIPVFYWDMTVLGVHWGCFNKPRQYHHTISSNLTYALRESIALIAEEGLENVIKRHQRCAQLLYDGLERLGIEYFVKDKAMRLPSVTTIMVPENVDFLKVISYAMEKYSMEIGRGLGPTAVNNQALRLGLMGYNSTEFKVTLLLKVLEEALEYGKVSVDGINESLIRS